MATLNSTSLTGCDSIVTSDSKTVLRSTGSIIQAVYARSDVITTYSALPAGDGTTITDLNISITPTSANNRIIVQWMINCYSSHEVVFLIHRNGSLITTAGEQGRNSIGNNRWVGFAPTPYDTSTSTTMHNNTLLYSQIAGTTSTITYAPAVRSSSASTYTWYLNRTISSTGADSAESTVSTAIAYEVVV